MSIKAKKMNMNVKLRPLKPRTAWSFSHWQDYQECAARYAYKRVLKLTPVAPPDSSSPLQRGTDIHKEGELFLNSRRTLPVPEAYGEYKKQMQYLRKLKATGEQQVALDKNLKRVEWFSKEAWLRIIYDALAWASKVRVLGVDFKTGKPKDWHDAQGHLLGMGALVLHPKAREAQIQFYYLDQGGPPASVLYRRSGLKDMIEQWRAEADKMLNDTICAPSPGPYCRWCDFAKAKGGPCEY